mmetsp:Transcript_1823/g.5998  ORF Transcript_1823/g.5998 Transcript_1823/m.5998 type:complete len:109 (+) Transcript_1823:1058-1384(+)
MKWSFERPRPRSLEERARRAEDLARAHALRASGFEILSDSMADEADSALGAWPTNYYVVGRDGRLGFVSTPQVVDAAAGEEVEGEVRRLRAHLLAAVHAWGAEGAPLM